MFPDFLCIGAQKAGTTWLYRNLCTHPDIWMPPIKELRYFSSIKRFKKAWFNQIKKRIKSRLLYFNLQNILWDFKYYFKPRNDKWYASLFDLGRGKVTGDMSPGYLALDTDSIGHIYKIMPHTKIIFIMRNPIHRAWSHSIMRLIKGEKKRIDSVSETEFINFFNKKDMLAKGDYLQILKNWQTYYPEKQFFIGFFDDIFNNPRGFLLSIYRFLEIDASDRHIPDTVEKKVNVGSGGKIPARYAKYLARLHYPQLKELSRVFGGYASAWLEYAEQLIKM